MKVNGGNYQIFVSTDSTTYKTIGYATGASLEISSDSKDTSNKDESASGSWASSEPSNFSWSFSSSNILSVGETKFGFDDLFTAMTNKTKLSVKICQTLESLEKEFGSGNGELQGDSWTAPHTPARKENGDLEEGEKELPAVTNGKIVIYTGEAYCNSLSLNMDNGDYADFSADFGGVGKLTQETLTTQQA